MKSFQEAWRDLLAEGGGMSLILVRNARSLRYDAQANHLWVYVSHAHRMYADPAYAMKLRDALADDLGENITAYVRALPQETFHAAPDT